MSLLEVMVRGSAWLALFLAAVILLVISVVSQEPDARRRDRLAGRVIWAVFFVLAWIGLAYAAGGGTVNP